MATAIISSLSYVDTVSALEKAELTRLESIVKNHSQLLASDHYTPFYQSEANILNEISRQIDITNRLNELQNSLTLIYFEGNQEPLIISAEGQIIDGTENPGLELIMSKRPLSEVSFGLDNEIVKDQLFYALPISFGNLKDLSGYLVIQEGLKEELSNARAVLFKRLLLAFLVIGSLAAFGKTTLNKIFKHEEMSKQKLKEYAEIARKRNEELERVSFVLSKSDNLIVMTDSHGIIEWLNINGAANNFTKDELNHFVGREIAEVSRYAQINEVIKTINRTKETITYEAKSYDSNREEFWASTTVTPILSESGKVECLLFVDADITKIKRAEAEISKLANFAQVNSNALIRVSNEGKILFANDSGKELLKIWNARVDGVLEKASLLNTIKMAFKLNEEQKLNLELKNRIFSFRFKPVKEHNFINIYTEDITEIKLAEKQYKKRASIVEQNNLTITDSINYAKKIQEAIIPGEDHLRKIFNDSFFMCKPKDIVSGDFIWLHEIQPQKEYLLALADCTGHGVPGAMMSIVGHSLLNEIVDSEKITDPSLILERLNREVIKTLRQKTEGQSSDGMDVGIVKVDVSNLSITFSGAYQDIYWMNGKLNMIRGDRQPIGGKHHDLDRKFTNQTFKISRGDSLFLTSDGFVDQFGGPNNKKFLKKRLSELINANCKYSMQAQSFIYKKAFEDWKGSLEQIDDVSFMGIKF